MANCGGIRVPSCTMGMAQPEQHPEAQARAQTHCRLGDAVIAAQARLIGDQAPPQGVDVSGLTLVRPVDRQLGHALNPVDDGRAQLGLVLGEPTPGCLAAPLRPHGQGDAGDQQEGEPGERQQRVVQQQEDEEEHRADGGDRHGYQHAHIEVVQGVDVGTDAAQQVAAVILLQTRGSQRLEMAVEPDPQLGDQPEGGLVVDQPLRVAAGGAHDGAEPDERGRREVVDGDPGDAGHRHGGDEPARQGHERDVGDQGQEGDQGAGDHPAAIGPKQAPETQQLLHRSFSRSGFQRSACPGAVWP
jgi:hypothetical protein